MDPGQILPLFLISVAAGILGAMLGLGGGIIIVPALTLLFHRDVHEAVGVSMVSVIATSISATGVYLRHGYVNVSLGLYLQLATVAGAIAGGYIGVGTKPVYLEILFGAMLLYTAYSMARGKSAGASSDEYLNENDLDYPYIHQFVDAATEKEHVYCPGAMVVGACASVGAGLLSGLLGVGGGFIKVPVMHLLMGVPLKAAIATSNYIIGMTAAASAMIYFSRGYVKPLTVAPCAIGVLLGAQIGSRIGSRMHSAALRWAFVALLVFLSAQMLKKAAGGG